MPQNTNITLVWMELGVLYPLNNVLDLKFVNKKSMVGRENLTKGGLSLRLYHSYPKKCYRTNNDKKK